MVGFEREVTGVEEVHFGAWVVALERLSARRQKEGIVLPPDGEQRRMRLAEVLLELRIALHVVRIVQEQVELDLIDSRAGPAARSRADTPPGHLSSGRRGSTGTWCIEREEIA